MAFPDIDPEPAFSRRRCALAAARAAYQQAVTDLFLTLNSNFITSADGDERDEHVQGCRKGLGVAGDMLAAAEQLANELPDNEV